MVGDAWRSTVAWICNVFGGGVGVKRAIKMRQNQRRRQQRDFNINLLRSILSAYKRTTGVIHFIYGVTVLSYLSLRYGENMANGEGWDL